MILLIPLVVTAYLAVAPTECALALTLSKDMVPNLQNRHQLDAARTMMAEEAAVSIATMDMALKNDETAPMPMATFLSLPARPARIFAIGTNEGLVILANTQLIPVGNIPAGHLVTLNDLDTITCEDKALLDARHAIARYNSKLCDTEAIVMIAAMANKRALLDERTRIETILRL